MPFNFLSFIFTNSVQIHAFAASSVYYYKALSNNVYIISMISIF